MFMHAAASCHLRGNCHPPPFNDLDGGIQIQQMLPSTWAQDSSLLEHVDGRGTSEAHGELAEGEELSGACPLGEKISRVAFALDTEELQHTSLHGLQHDVDATTDVGRSFESGFRIRDISRAARIGEHRRGMQLGEAKRVSTVFDDVDDAASTGCGVAL